jgi:hypothetical protein
VPARPELCLINTHPVANHDGDWSEANRFYPLHRAELAVLARVVNEAGPRAVVCGDFNVGYEDTDLQLLTGFLRRTADAARTAAERLDRTPAGQRQPRSGSGSSPRSVNLEPVVVNPRQAAQASPGLRCIDGRTPWPLATIRQCR